MISTIVYRSIGKGGYIYMITRDAIVADASWEVRRKFPTRGPTYNNNGELLGSYNRYSDAWDALQNIKGVPASRED